MNEYAKNERISWFLAEQMRDTPKGNWNTITLINVF